MDLFSNSSFRELKTNHLQNECTTFASSSSYENNQNVLSVNSINSFALVFSELQPKEPHQQANSSHFPIEMTSLK